MHNLLRIYTEPLRKGVKEKIDLSVDPSFLDIQEEGLRFKTPVHVTGEAYTTDTDLILHLSCSTEVELPCCICNDFFTLSLKASDIYATEVLEELDSAVYDYSVLLREEILLQLPTYAECHGGQCPERETLSAYLKPKEPPKESKEHHPFRELPLP